MSKIILIKQMWIVAALVAILAAGSFASAQTTVTSCSRAVNDSALPRVERQIARLAKGAGGVVGVSAVHLETNRRVSLNGS